MGIGALNKILLIVYHSPPDISLPSFCVFPGSRNPPFTFHAHHVTILVYSPQDLNAICDLCGLCLRDYKVLHPTMFSKTFFFSKTQTCMNGVQNKFEMTYAILFSQISFQNNSLLFHPSIFWNTPIYIWILEWTRLVAQTLIHIIF